jgi:hypothetical protein
LIIAKSNPCNIVAHDSLVGLTIMRIDKLAVYVIIWVQAASLLACSSTSPATLIPEGPITPSSMGYPVGRETKIPTNAIKMSPETDEHPPMVYTSEFEKPVPVPGRVDTAGAEDSPFITEDGDTLYFFFTPDVNIPVEKQVLDGVTGLYVSKKVGNAWRRPERIILQEPGKVAIDGCEFVQGEVMWFCSVREGLTGVHWFVAKFQDGKWQNWKIADFNPDYKVGELYISGDGSELFFGSDRSGGKGNLDIWVSQKIDGEWGEPVNVDAVNTADSEGWPALSPDGNELWFTRNYAIWRSKKVKGAWQAAEQVVSPLAGEPSLDANGNLYFVHHFYENNKMIEADIYVAYKK